MSDASAESVTCQSFRSSDSASHLGLKMLDQIHYVSKMKFPEINELESLQRKLMQVE